MVTIVIIVVFIRRDKELVNNEEIKENKVNKGKTHFCNIIISPPSVAIE